MSAPGRLPPHIHRSARAARPETSQRPHAVPARPSCAPPGYLRSVRRGGTEPQRPRLLPPAPRPQPGPRTPMFPQLRALPAEGPRPLQTCSGIWGSPQGPPRGASEDIGAAAEPLESYGVPLACSLGAIWLHVLVTHQEGCAPRGSRRTHTASARPAQPPPAQRTALRPGPPSARPTPAPPPAETPAPAHNRGGKTLARSGVGCPSPESPQAEDLGRPTRQFQVPSTQSRSPSCPPSLSNFPFSSSDRSDPLPGFPPAKTGAGSPLPVALLWGRAPLPAAGLDLPTRNLGQACH